MTIAVTSLVSSIQCFQNMFVDDEKNPSILFLVTITSSEAYHSMYFRRTNFHEQCIRDKDQNWMVLLALFLLTCFIFY